MKPIPHPPPFQSALWPHLDLIRKLRLSRKSWPAIAVELAALGVRIDRSALRKFFKRAQKGKPPLGFVGESTSAERAPMRSASPLVPEMRPGIADPLFGEVETENPYRGPLPGKKAIVAQELLKPVPKVNGDSFAKWHDQHATEFGDIYDEARRAIRQEQKSKLTIVKPNGLL